MGAPYMLLFHGGQKIPYMRKIINTAPIAYWPLNETSGTTLYDATGNGFNGVYAGVTLSNASAPGGGMCPLFDGINDKAEILNDPLTALQASLNHSEFTLTCWAKVLNAAVWTDSAYRSTFGINVTNTNRAYFLKNNTNNNIQFIYNGNNASTKVHDWTSYSYTGWMYLVHTISVSGNAMRSYINNVQFATPATTITAYVGNPNVRIGVNPLNGLDSWWKGWISHVAIYNRALTDSEISSLYNWGV